MRILSAAAVGVALLADGAWGFVATPSGTRPLCRPRAGASARMMSAPPTPKFSLPLADDTRVSLAFDRDHCIKMAAEVNNILGAFKRIKQNAADGGKPYKEDAVSFKDTVDGLNILLECNPNLYPDPFKAKVFVKLWDDKVEVSSQADLTRITDVIKQYLAATKA